MASADAGRAIYGLADSVGELLRRAADELSQQRHEPGVVGSAAEAWLGEARRITYDIPPIGAALVQAEQGRRLNVRALGTPDVGPGLRQGLEALEAEQELAGGLAISSIPTLMAFRDGILLFAQPGALPAPALEQVIAAVREADMDDIRAKIAAQQSAS